MEIPEMSLPSFTTVHDTGAKGWNPFDDDMEDPVFLPFPQQEQQAKANVPTPPCPPVDKNQNGNGGGLGCGFVIEKMEMAPYLKALERNLIPFVAFFPAGSSKRYLLKITALVDKGVYLLVPASKEDVCNAMKHESSSSMSKYKPEHERGNITVVAFVKQFYDPEEKSFDIILESPSSRLDYLDLIATKDFTDYVVSTPNVDEEDPEEDEDEQVEEKEMEIGNEGVANAEENPSEIAMPTLVAVNCVPSTSDKPSTRDGRSKSKEEEFMVVTNRLQTMTIIKKDPDEENMPVAEAKDAAQGSQKEEEVPLGSGFRTPDPENRRKDPPPAATPVMAPRVRRRDRKSSNESTDGKGILNDITNAPRRPPPASRLKKRGRPRKLNFDECVESESSGPETKVYKRSK